MVTHRGHHEEIDVFPGMPLENKLSGNVVDLCPVGALGSKDFLYTQRVWYLKDHPGVCSLCSTGCSTYVDTNKDIVYRIRPRTNHQAQGYFICDDGRWGYHYVNSAKRFTRPQMMVDGRLQPVSWSTFLANIRKQITEVSRLSPDKLLLVLSPFLTVEEAFLWSVFGKELSAKTRLALGPVPVIGEDDRYPKDVHGNSVEPVKFTIRAEKCPNRLGVSTVLRHFQGELLHWNEMWNESDWQAMIFVGGYPNPHHLELMLPAELTLPRLTIVQDLFPSRLTKSASYVVPGTAVFEKEGTFVNHSGLAQSFPRAVRPPLEARGELQTAADLLGRLGLVQIRQIRQELAAILPEFATIESAAPIGKRLALATV
jgi:NADH-quinone oxidoreductase subunit G